MRSKLSPKSSPKNYTSMSSVRGPLLLSFLLIQACASGPKVKNNKIIVDNSSRGAELPQWVSDPKQSWEKENVVYFKSMYTVNGNQRLNGCYDLAKIEQSEQVLEAIKHEIKGEIALANEGIAESADPLITKSITKSFNGMIKGLWTSEQAFERYLIGDTERLDCFILSSMTKSDYLQLKNRSLDQVASVSDDVAKIVRERQKNFFQSDSVAEASVTKKLESSSSNEAQ